MARKSVKSDKSVNPANPINLPDNQAANTTEPDNLDRSVVNVSGPVNVVRLEGLVAGIKKVIYLFMDIHEPVMFQTQCTNIYSKDINKYLAESFYELNNSDKKYDFFMELRPSNIVMSKDPKYLKVNNLYLNQIIKTLVSIMNYDKETNKMKISDKIKNVRIHYLDIRDYLQHHIVNISDETLEIANMMSYNGINIPSVKRIIDIYAREKQMLDDTIKIFTDAKYVHPDKKTSTIRDHEPAWHTEEFVPEVVTNISDKIRNRYNHEKVQKVINSIFDKQVSKLKDVSADIENALGLFSQYVDKLNIPRNKLIKRSDGEYFYGLPYLEMKAMDYNIYKICYDIHNKIMDIFVTITDLYFLRRFLDKDYVTNAMAYTGGSHSLNYISILIKYFGFKITHTAYSLIEDMTKLNIETKNRADKNEDLGELFYPPELYQCSDMTHFPKKFE